ncbi:uncharacterized protein [Dermacentor andersoni]|uniref:uncharacterized protein isoform X1 n=1 Tax=Dermacentor andersoni TaxID=34620 RepID=UPI003B3B0C28
MDSAKSGGEVELAVPGVDRAPLSSPAGSVDRLLHQTAEEEEMEAKGLNTSGEMDFLILDEVKVDEEQEGRSELQETAARSAEIGEPVRSSTPKLDAEDSSKGDGEHQKGLKLSAEGGDDDDTASASSCGEDGGKKADDGKACGVKQKGDGIASMIQDEDEPEKCKEEPDPKKDVEELLEGAVIESPAPVAEESAEAEKSLDSSDDVQVVAVEQPVDTASMEKDAEDEELDSAKENKVPVLNGAANIGIAVQVSGLKDEDPDDPDPVDCNADDVDSKPPKRSASNHGILADLKRALSMIDAESGKPKRFKLDMDDGRDLEQATDPPAASAAVAAASGGSMGVPVGPNLVVLSREQLEQYVSRRVRECLVAQATALLQPMEKKCDTLHRALERWRRRSFQLQKQLNEFVCEQEKCANARRSRRSVGVCVRMPPLKPQTPAAASPAVKTVPTTVMAPTSVASRAPNVTTTRAPNVIVSTVASGSTSPARPPTPAQQIRVTGTNASMLAAQLGLKPNQHMKLVSVSTPSGGSTAVVTRMPPQLQSAPSSSTSVSSSMPVPMQLIANTASMTGSPSPAMKVGVPTSSAASPAGTSVRTVAVVSSAASGTSPASGVKIIDLTQEEEAANAHAKALSAGGVSLGSALHKIVSSSSIPVLSAAPTSLVQVSSTSSPSTTRVSIAGTSVVLSHMTGGTVTQAGGNTLRLNSSPLVGPPARVTYLVPSLPPGMVVTPREAGPRLAAGSGAQPMQTILLRMASPQGGFTTVPGGTIAVPANLMPANASGSPTGTPAGATTMMVATATGSQVRMVRAPPPMTLPRGGATLTLPPGTTLVRAPMASNMRPGAPQQMSVVRPPVPAASAPATPTTLSLPPKPTLQVQVPGAGASTPVRLPQPPLQVQVPASGGSAPGAVRPAKPEGNVSLIKTQHPASLPPTPRYIDDPKKKRLPPKPALKITKAASGEKADAAATIRKVPPAKKAVVVKKEVAEPKPPTAEDMEKVLEQWQMFLDNQGGNGGDKEDGKEQVRRRLPYHAQRPLRHACLCRLGTCRYDKLAATYKERLHADFGRLESTQQLRELLGRMYTKGKAKRERNKRASKEDSSAATARKGRCKWVYWLPASGTAQLRRKVCKAAFMAVHGITEKRTRDVQLLWMRLRAKRGHTPTGDESDIEREELMPGTYTDVDDEDEVDESVEKPVLKQACKPRRGRKILRVSESEDSEAADDVAGVKRKSDVTLMAENGPKKAGSKVVVVKPPLLDSNIKTNKQSTKASQDDDETEVEGDDEAEDEDVPYLDISGFEPICTLEEDSENLVLSLPRGVFGDDEEDAGAT